MALEVTMDLKLPSLMADIIDKGIGQGLGIGYVWKIGLQMVGVYRHSGDRRFGLHFFCFAGFPADGGRPQKGGLWQGSAVQLR